MGCIILKSSESIQGEESHAAIPTKAAEGEYDSQVTVYPHLTLASPSQDPDAISMLQTLGLQSAEIMPTMLEAGLLFSKISPRYSLGGKGFHYSNALIDQLGYIVLEHRL